MAAVHEDRNANLSPGAAIKVPCRVATTANITLSGLQTIDGVTVAAGDRILVKNQTAGSDNGVYVVSTGSWTRSSDFDGNRDVVSGTFVKVNSGTAGTGFWYLTNADPITIGTTALTFSMVSPTPFVVVSAFGQTLVASADATAARSNLGLGSMATQSSTGVAVTGGTESGVTISGSSINGTPIGTSTPSSAQFTTVVGTSASFTSIAASSKVNLATSDAGQIAFPNVPHVSTDPNTLDDYSESTSFTPTVKFGGSTAGWTLGSNSGVFIKLGRFAFLGGVFQIGTTGTSTGQLSVTGPSAPYSFLGGNVHVWQNLGVQVYSMRPVYAANSVFFAASTGTSTSGNVINVDGAYFPSGAAITYSAIFMTSQ